MTVHFNHGTSVNQCLINTSDGKPESLTIAINRQINQLVAATIHISILLKQI